MDILQVCPDTYGETGGISSHVRNIAEGLALKHNVTVFATNRGFDFPRNELRNGVVVDRFRRYMLNNAYVHSWEMLLKLREAKFDVVHAHGYHAFPFHYSTLAKCEKLILTPHFHGSGHSTFRSCLLRLLKPLGRRTLEKADKIVAVSRFEKSLLRREFGFAAEKIAVVPNGVSYSEFSSLERSKRDFRSILYVGYLVDFKGVRYLVEVLPKLPNDIVLDIVGDGPLKPFLERRACELGVSSRIRFYQDLPRRELLQMYTDADVFVSLSMYEAYSLVVAEALTAGTPCVVANTSAMSEWIDDESCFGIEVPSTLNDLSALITRVVDYSGNRRDIRRMRRTKIPDWTDVVRQLERIYSY